MGLYNAETERREEVEDLHSDMRASEDQRWPR